MARPLRKCRPDGTLYTRPTEIEVAIDEALALDAPTRVARAALRDRKAAGFLRREVLVHLIRDAKRTDDQSTLAQLFTILARRCDATLRSKVPDSHAYASDIRADTLAQLGELIATDETEKGGHRLDFFEVRFALAFAKLRRTVVRSTSVEMSTRLSLRTLTSQGGSRARMSLMSTAIRRQPC